MPLSDFFSTRLFHRKKIKNYQPYSNLGAMVYVENLSYQSYSARNVLPQYIFPLHKIHQLYTQMNQLEEPSPISIISSRMLVPLTQKPKILLAYWIWELGSLIFTT